MHGKWGDEVWDGVAEGWAGSGWSVYKGASDGGFSIRMKLKVEVFHEGVVSSEEVVQQTVSL